MTTLYREVVDTSTECPWPTRLWCGVSVEVYELQPAKRGQPIRYRASGHITRATLLREQHNRGETFLDPDEALEKVRGWLSVLTEFEAARRTTQGDRLSRPWSPEEVAILERLESRRPWKAGRFWCEELGVSLELRGQVERGQKLLALGDRWCVLGRPRGIPA